MNCKKGSFRFVLPQVKGAEGCQEKLEWYLFVKIFVVCGKHRRESKEIKVVTASRRKEKNPHEHEKKCKHNFRTNRINVDFHI